MQLQRFLQSLLDATSEAAPVLQSEAQAREALLNGLLEGHHRTPDTPSFGFAGMAHALVDVTHGHTVFGWEITRAEVPANAFEQQAMQEGRSALEIEVGRRVRLVRHLLQSPLTRSGCQLFLPVQPSLPGVTAEGLDAVLGALPACALPADRIVLQIYGSARRQDPASMLALVATFRRHGYRVALGHFGEGEEGLHGLQGLVGQVPPDYVRLGRHLTGEVATERCRRRVVEALAAMAHDLGITVICDDVRTLANSDVLAQMGLVRQQGPLFDGGGTPVAHYVGMP